MCSRDSRNKEEYQRNTTCDNRCRHFPKVESCCLVDDIVLGRSMSIPKSAIILTSYHASSLRSMPRIVSTIPIDTARFLRSGFCE